MSSSRIVSDDVNPVRPTACTVAQALFRDVPEVSEGDIVRKMHYSVPDLSADEVRGPRPSLLGPREAETHWQEAERRRSRKSIRRRFATGLVMISAPCSHLGMGHAEAGAGAMLVACRLAGLSALGAHYAGVKWRAMRGRVASLVASFRWQRKSEDWHAIASLATTPPLHRWAILTAASASDCETRS